MKKNILILVLLCSQLLSTGYAFAKKIAKLKDFYKDPFILIDEKKIYIWDRYLRKVFIYSKNTYEKISEFGKRGEGPGEFIGINNVFLLDDYICVSSFPKLCFFNKKGKFKKQIKGPANTGGFMPFGTNFVGIVYQSSDRYSKESKILFCLFDSSMQKKRDIFSTEIYKATWPGEYKENVMWVRDCIKAVPYKDKLIIGSTYQGFHFEVFDKNGDKLYIISRKYDKRKIADNEKKMKLDEFKKKWGKENGKNIK